VSDESFLYYPSQFKAGVLMAEFGSPDSSHALFSRMAVSNNDMINELRDFEIGGTALLRGDLSSFDSLFSKRDFTQPVLQQEKNKLMECKDKAKRIKRKSAFTAGALSAVIPGLGKVYAGNNGQALASFLTVGLMGGIAAENYIRMGPSHPQTIFFAGVCGLFYIGNIWGSAVSVQLVKTEKELENKHNILVGIKLPVAKFFN
jgi:hypothetical protein